tara:strand:- start:3911 stop:5581 length:1671 start_codon:yes stop_codon:yes gene_type:complete
MRKKRILWVNEAHWQGTGYSVYAKEVLARLSKVEEFEVAELATHVDREDKKVHNSPWKVYPNKPLGSDDDFQSYLNSPSRIFGENTFNNALIDFKPDIVMDIRDWWMFEFEQRSPFRDFFHWAIMPTVDATPQNPMWINTFASADSVFAYSEFGRDTLLKQSDSINFIDIAPPCANKEVFDKAPDKRKHKDDMGLDSEIFLVGTVMRNQRRKLYPDLFKAFRMFLDETEAGKAFLYCHVFYPDIGWEIPQLLNEFGLENRVLFGYKCKNCGDLTMDFYRDAMCHCGKCKKFSKKLIGVNNSIDSEQLSKIYNTFDLYVQYANSEGFGMPQLEAAFCGVPVASVNYSAMESVINNIGGIPMEPLALSMECETGCYRAIPDNDKLVATIKQEWWFHLDRLSGFKDEDDLADVVYQKSRNHYDWDKTAQVWIDHFKTIPMRDWSETYLSPIKVLEPATDMPNDIVTTEDQVNYLFTHVLHRPDLIGGWFWSKVIKDVTFGYRVNPSEEDYYFNESHLPSQNKYQPYNMEGVVRDLTNMRQSWNKLEIQRGQINAEQRNH